MMYVKVVLCVWIDTQVLLTSGKIVKFNSVVMLSRSAKVSADRQFVRATNCAGLFICIHEEQCRLFCIFETIAYVS